MQRSYSKCGTLDTLFAIEQKNKTKINVNDNHASLFLSPDNDNNTT